MANPTPLKLRKLGESAHGGFGLMLMGDPGVGKTSCLRTLAGRIRKLPSGEPDWSRVIYIDGDGGGNSIIDLKDVKVWTPFKDGPLGQLLSHLQSDPTQYDVVWVDGIDFIMRECWGILDEIEQRQPKPDPRSVWGGYGKAMWNWLSKIARLEGPVIVFVDHVTELDSKVVGPDDPKFVPATAGGNSVTPDALMGMFDYVFFMTTKRIDPKLPPQRVFVTSREMGKGDPRYSVKSRVPLDRTPLPGIMPADLNLVYEKLFPTSK